MPITSVVFVGLSVALLSPVFQVPASEPVPSDAILIKVSGEGYQPSRIELKAGKPVKLAFYRVDSKNCGDVVDFPALHIKRDLPAGKTTVIELPAMQKGTLNFACGMGMLKGELVISQNGK
jgi:plastocyanin domain-containing protein